jgi:hypothetical protein
MAATQGKADEDNCPVKKLRHATETCKESFREWKRTSESLRAVAKQLKDWALPKGPMGSIIEPPQKDVVERVAEALNDLLQAFEDLEECLKKLDLIEQSPWQDLLNGINSATKKYFPSKVKSLLVTYVKFRRDQEDGRKVTQTQETKQENNRLIIAEAIVELAKSIEETLKKAEEKAR